MSDPAVSIAGRDPTRDPVYTTAILLPYKMAVSMLKIVYLTDYAHARTRCVSLRSTTMYPFSARDIIPLKHL